MRVGHLLKAAAFKPQEDRARKARSSGYPNTAVKDATVPQIAAQSPSDRSKTRIKDAPVSGQS
jgi:hypothetical protein